MLKDKNVRLLIFDPSTSKKQINLFHSIVNANLMRTLRRSIQGLKSKQYQIVAVTGIISDHEYNVSISVKCFSFSVLYCPILYEPGHDKTYNKTCVVFG